MIEMSGAPNATKGEHRVSTAGRIVVGVDGSAPAAAALRWAVEEARLRDWTLEVVHAEFARRTFLDDYPELERAEEGVLEASVRQARELAPELTILATLQDPPAASALLQASKDADMLVVGSRGLGAVKVLTLGSVSRECVHRAQCPVVVIRAADTSRPAGTTSAAAPAER